MANKFWIGLDVGVEKTSICVIDDAGQPLREAVCETTAKAIHEKIKFLRRRRFVTVGIEAGSAATLARELRNLGYSLEIYETRQLSQFLKVRRNKTDAGDAKGIAQAGRVGAPLISKVHLKSLECQTLACRLKLRRFLIRVRTRGIQVLRRQLEQFGKRLSLPARSIHLRSQVEAKLKEIFGKRSDPLASELRQLLNFCEELKHYQKVLDDGLRQLAQGHPVCRQFLTVPGVGPICALSFYSAVGEPHRFRHSADVGAYLGLTPRVHQSGLTRRMGRISKMGQTDARSMLVTASTRFVRCTTPDDPLHAWTVRLEQRSGKLKSRVALARKLATVMLAMWKTGETYRPRPVPGNPGERRPKYGDSSAMGLKGGICRVPAPLSPNGICQSSCLASSMLEKV